MNTDKKNTHTYQVTVEQMGRVAQDILSYNPAVIMLSGSLGAGKTTLTQNILQQLGIYEPVASPTYAYVTMYTVESGAHEGLTIYHFDLYRLTSLQDFIAAGFEEYLYQPNVLCIVEWPEYIRPLVCHKACDVYLEYCHTSRNQLSDGESQKENTQRAITVTNLL